MGARGARGARVLFFERHVHLFESPDTGGCIYMSAGAKPIEKKVGDNCHFFDSYRNPYAPIFLVFLASGMQ